MYPDQILKPYDMTIDSSLHLQLFQSLSTLSDDSIFHDAENHKKSVNLAQSQQQSFNFGKNILKNESYEQIKTIKDIKQSKKSLTREEIMDLFKQLSLGKSWKDIVSLNKLLKKYDVKKLQNAFRECLLTLSKYFISVLPKSQKQGIFLSGEQFHLKYFKRIKVFRQLRSKGIDLIQFINDLLNLRELQKQNKKSLSRGITIQSCPVKIKEVLISISHYYHKFRHLQQNSELSCNKNQIEQLPENPSLIKSYKSFATIDMSQDCDWNHLNSDSISQNHFMFFLS